MTDSVTTDIAANLRAAVKASGLTQQQVAERVDMDPTALSKVLSGKRKCSSLELALICTATGSDVLGILGADPMHGPSYRRGYQEAILHMRRAHERGDLEQVFLPRADEDGDYTGCGVQHPDVSTAYCDLPIHPWPQTHHADLFWETGSWDDAKGRHVPDVAPSERGGEVGPCAFCRGTHPSDLDHCICGRWRGGEVGALAEVERRLQVALDHGGTPEGDATYRHALRIAALVAAQQPPDPLAEGVEALLALAREIEDGRIQRPGMQRRRLWADRIRRSLSAREQQADSGAVGGS